MNWDKLRVFHAVAEAGSFTRAGDRLHLSQPAVSRQVAALEESLAVVLFHRHSRGLILTEQGETLYATTRDVYAKLAMTEANLSGGRDRPEGPLTISTTNAFGAIWLTPRLRAFHQLYPGIELRLKTSDDALDLAMREADVAIRMRRPAQPDLIQRRLFTVHYHAFASPDYVKRFGEPKTIEELDDHRLVSFGGNEPSYLLAAHWLADAGRDGRDRRQVHLTVNNIGALQRAMEAGAGIGILPDYAVDGGQQLVQVLRETEMPSLESYLVYAEEMRSVARVQAFRDFLVSKAQRWTY